MTGSDDSERDRPSGEVFGEAYEALRRLAMSRLRRSPEEHTLQATDLVHEVYLKLADQGWRDSEHFLAAAATAVRWILVDRARARLSAKRGGGARPASLSEVASDVGEDRRFLELHEALQRLERDAPRLAQLVQLRYFGGATIDEAASVLGVSPATVKREWLVAKARLLRDLRPDTEEGM